jgi:Tol biopolymer transport system component
MVYWGPNESETWLVEANGQPQKLSELHLFPRFFAGNSKFAYLKDENLWEVDRESGTQQLLASVTGIYPSWSDFSAEAGIIWFLDVAGADWDNGELGKLKWIDGDGNIHDVSESYLRHYPVLSPDGKSIAFDDGGQLVVYHLESGKQMLDIGEDGLFAGLEFGRPFWSPDQQKLAWIAYEPGSQKIVIFDLETRTAEVVQIAERSYWYIHEVHWQPNGSKLAITRGNASLSNPKNDSWLVDLTTMEATPIGTLYSVQWSPDGAWLGYTQEIENRMASYWVMTADGRERYNLGIGYSPIWTWSPDSRFLIFCGIEETAYEGTGYWLTSPENGWMPVAIDFGYDELCNEIKWLSLEQPEMTAYTLPTVLPSPTPTITPIPPTPTATSAAVAACELNPQTTLSAANPLQNTILFVSNSNEPLTTMGTLASLPHVGSRSYAPQLWAVSLDGKQANRLTAEAHGIGWHIPETNSLPVWLMSNTDLIVDNERIWQILLPSQCDEVLEDYRNQHYACGDFKISSDGKWATFNVGDYISGYGSQPGLINLETGEMQLNTLGTGVIRFLPNDERLVGNSWGEGGEVWWANSLTGEALRLGGAGRLVWNEGEAAVAGAATDFHGVTGTVWGFNVETDHLFLPEPQIRGVDHQPIWTPDEAHLLYRHHDITNTDSYTRTYGPGQIHLVDALSGEKQILAADPEYHFQLCGAGDEVGCRWAEDWIKVRRYPYQPDPFYFEDHQDSGYSCTWYGRNCPGPAENLALNWRTGEIVPWQEVEHLLPPPVATAVPPTGPNLTATPVYANPEIGYALYPGQDGRSLWCVPEGGSPQKWVDDAELFVYVP